MNEPVSDDDVAMLRPVFDGWDGTDETLTMPLRQYVDQTDALLHLATRRHAYTDTCDRCANVARVVKALVGLS